MKSLAFVAPLLLLLAACAPGAAGSGARTALDVGSGEQVQTVQGGELFLRYGFQPSEFGLGPADLNGAFWIPAGVDEESANLISRFALRNVRVPLRWSLELPEVRAHRTVESEFGRETGGVSYRIEAVVRLQVPPDAELGISNLRFELVSRGGGSQVIELPVRVRAPIVE